MVIQLRSALLLLCVVLTGCQASGGDVELSSLPTLTLDEAKAVWQTKSAESYQFHIKRQCYCDQAYVRPMTVIVEQGQVVSATYSDDGSRVPDEIVKNLETIDALFKKIVDAKGYHRRELSFDNQWGYPARIFLDRRDYIADDELKLEISQLELLND